MTERPVPSRDLAGRNPTADRDVPDPQFDAMTSRLLRREALRRAAEELNPMTGPGLEQTLARVSAEVTAEAAYRQAEAAGVHAASVRKRVGPK